MVALIPEKIRPGCIIQTLTISLPVFGTPTSKNKENNKTLISEFCPNKITFQCKL